MELVPFDNKWAGSETKLDLKAWYRRPSEHGGFSVVGPFPLRRHLDWTRKGFEYVTLATGEDVQLVERGLKAEGVVDMVALRKSYDARGNFNIAAYVKSQQVKDADHLADLQAKVDKFGVETVTEMMRMHEPNFQMPASIVTTKAKAKVN